MGVWKLLIRVFLFLLADHSACFVSIAACPEIAYFTEKEDWDFSVYDYKAYTKIDPNFLSVAVNEEEDVLGFIGVLEHTPEVVYICRFFVFKRFRGNGVGKKLWSAMKERVGDRNLVLDGVSDIVPWYQKQGFQYIYTSIHFYKLIVTENMLHPEITQYEFSELKNDSKTWKDVINYDKLVYMSINREHLLKPMLIGENVCTTVAYDNQNVVGYGSIHRNPNGEYGLRNVFADSGEVFEAILRKLFEPLEVGSVLYFSLFDDKRLPEYLQQIASFDSSATRMFTKRVIEVDRRKIWIDNPHTL